jgi:hypothetical protein
MWLFRILFAVDTAVALVAFYFFVIGIADGSVSSFNITMWLGLLGGISAVLATGIALYARGRRGAACAVLAILGVPGILAGLFVLSLIILQPRWN